MKTKSEKMAELLTILKQEVHPDIEISKTKKYSEISRSYYIEYYFKIIHITLAAWQKDGELYGRIMGMHAVPVTYVRTLRNYTPAEVYITFPDQDAEGLKDSLYFLLGLLK